MLFFFVIGVFLLFVADSRRFQSDAPVLPCGPPVPAVLCDRRRGLRLAQPRPPLRPRRSRPEQARSCRPRPRRGRHLGVSLQECGDRSSNFN